MATFEEMTLGRSALDYIRARLSSGKALSRSLLAHVDLEDGKTITYLPSGIGLQQAHQFAAHQLEPYLIVLPDGLAIRTTGDGGNAPKAWLAQKIQTYLQSVPDSFCILEDPLRDASVSYNLSEGVNEAILSKEVYYFLFSHTGDDASILRALGEASSIEPPMVGVLTTASHEEIDTLLKQHRLTIEFLQTLAKRADHIILAAYLSESYVVWERLPGRRQRAQEIGSRLSPGVG